VIDEHFNAILPNFFDAIGLMLMIRITHQQQLIMSRRRVPCLDSYLDKLNVNYGDGQLDLNLERLRVAVDDLLVKLARMFSRPKHQTIFLINNYDMILAVLEEEIK